MYMAFILPLPRSELRICANIGTTEHSVLPEPVGAITSESFLRNISGEAIFCILVRCLNPCRRNSFSSAGFGTVIFCINLS